MTAGNEPGRSLAFWKFKLALTREIRAVYYNRISYEYAGRWWAEQSKTSRYTKITDHPGDAGRPFSGIQIAPSQYLEIRPQMERILRGNAIVNLVTTFETYVGEALKRAIYLKPTLLEESDVQLSAGVLAKQDSLHDLRMTLARTVIAKHIRNKSHREMLKWIDDHLKTGILNGEKAMFQRWNRWVQIRNELVHVGREIGPALVRIWPERFERRSREQQLDDCDVTNCHVAAHRLALVIDRQLLRVSIEKHDAHLMAREMFVAYGNEDPAAIAFAVSKYLSVNYSRSDAEWALAHQKRHEMDPRREFEFSDEMFQPQLPDVALESSEDDSDIEGS